MRQSRERQRSDSAARWLMGRPSPVGRSCCLGSCETLRLILRAAGAKICPQLGLWMISILVVDWTSCQYQLVRHHKHPRWCLFLTCFVVIELYYQSTVDQVEWTERKVKGKSPRFSMKSSNKRHQQFVDWRPSLLGRVPSVTAAGLVFRPSASLLSFVSLGILCQAAESANMKDPKDRDFSSKFETP